MKKYEQITLPKTEIEMIKTALGSALEHLEALEEKLEDDERSVSEWLAKDGC